MLSGRRLAIDICSSCSETISSIKCYQVGSRGLTWPTLFRRLIRYIYVYTLSPPSLTHSLTHTQLYTTNTNQHVYDRLFTVCQLDAGVHENVALYSRDEQSVLVVSYADIKACLHSTFTEVLTAGQAPSNHTATNKIKGKDA